MRLLIKGSFWFGLVLVLLPLFSSESSTRLASDPKVQFSDAFTAVSGAYDKAKDTVAKGQEQGQQALHDAQKMVADTQTRLESFAREQPVLVAALGLAFGAALGASLPITEAEKKYMGAAGKLATEKGTDMAKKVADQVTGTLAGSDIGAKVGELADAVSATVTQGLKKSS